MVELFRSNFVFGLQGKLYQNFIDDIAKPIIEKVISTDDYEIIGFERHLSFQDFKNKENKIFDYIYTDFLDDIKKENNKVVYRKKVCITLDERLCIDICPNTGRKITTIKLAGVELAYFIYFDVKEFFDFVDQENKNKQTKKSDKNIFLLNNKKANKVNEKNDLKQSFILENSSNNPENQIDKQISHSTKIGYIRNHSSEYTYIRTSLNRGDVFKIKHTSFINIKCLPIGATIKAECLINDLGKIVNVESYSPVPISESNFNLNKFEGKLKRKMGEDSAFMDSQDTVIYVPPRCAKHFKENKIYNVQCLAAQFLDKNNNLNWEALEVIEILGFKK
ncbi:hypothetical protein [Faucicola boevrei]|uniref:hypothetical protein n=1 Tax=Faucicola boevrei TaxID=346665 RepID=UPI00036D2B37|nr:hypothetical protein [Moraxella boevrei]